MEKSPPSNAGSNLGAIVRLERYIERLWKTFVWAIFLIILLPVFLYTYFEMGHATRRTRDLAHQFQILLYCREKLDAGSVEWLSTAMREQMRAKRLRFLEIERGGRLLIRLGTPKAAWYLPRIVEEDDPTREVRIRLQLGPAVTWGEITRIIAIHLVVASFFLLLGYLLPIRALREAVADVKLAHTLVIHSGQLSAIGEIYSVLMHELNNPLGILLNRVELVQETLKQASPSEIAHDLEVIERHARRISEILKGTLIFSRKSSSQWQEIDLGELAREIFDLLKSPLQKGGIVCRLELPKHPVVVTASPTQLRQVLLNLVNNARDAMPDGGELLLKVFASGKKAVVEVRDTGCGFDEAIRNQLFQPFFTTKPAGKGTGLGLAISQGIISDHGGCLEAESEPGKGSAFRFFLPLKGESDAAGNEGEEDPRSRR